MVMFQCFSVGPAQRKEASMIKTVLAAAAITLASTGAAMSGDYVTQTTGYDDFSDQFCATERNDQHIFIVPTTVFGENASVTCDDGDSMLRTSEPADDPGHTVYNIDPPEGSEAGFDCDGKADTGMSLVALNCLPANMESADHQ